ncbi:hypothetical protein Xcel_2036 [Xylanimonas cellulosilytica DSM 15894]|uniref:Integral membrane protein n=1 Tax=Xylanimonas cellulosilytica (strain DSM 15894 / JCM 12276 / CECT 5975 / KCTC 9989 / LMG 20990 / NBRC 107835 / XIL07) TaxID=446471 RepID=D1BTS6_XYLCX|nr:DUF4191 domain-containing protein [Xylanimonas cellulosilytica]ACZ31055.1 hypothetical protein Xcel_2036 [Xylanimonas cellulosilytica DSM 15894]
MARSNASADATPAKAKKPKKQRWYHQVWAAYKMTRQQDPSVTWVLLGIFVGVLLAGIAIGLATGHPYYATFVALPFALLATMYMLTRRAERAAYTRIKGQPGAARAALGTVRGGWTFEDEPVAVNARTQDFVFRGVGRPGVVLVSEGPVTRVDRLLEDERRRTARVLPNVPIHLIQMGDGEGQVELTKLGRTVSKLKPKLTKPEVAEVSKRLKALGGQRLPVPKGIDPFKARPDRKGMRGR